MKWLLVLLFSASALSGNVELEPGFSDMVGDPNKVVITSAAKVKKLDTTPVPVAMVPEPAEFIEFMIDGASAGKTPTIKVGQELAVKLDSPDFGQALTFNVKIDDKQFSFTFKSREKSRSPREFAEQLPRKELAPGSEYTSGEITVEGIEVADVAVKWTDGTVRIASGSDVKEVAYANPLPDVKVKNNDKVQLVFKAPDSRATRKEVTLSIGDMTRVAVCFTGPEEQDAWSRHLSFKWYLFNEWQVGESPEMMGQANSNGMEEEKTNSQFSPLGFRLSYFMYDDQKQFKRLADKKPARQLILHSEGFSVKPLVPEIEDPVADPQRVVLREGAIKGFTFQSLVGYGWLFPHRGSNGELPSGWEMAYEKDSLASVNGTWLHFFVSAGGRMLEGNDWRSKYHGGIRIAHQRPGKLLNGAWIMLSTGTDHLFTDPRTGDDIINRIEKSDRRFITGQIPLYRLALQGSEVPIIFRYQFNHGSHLSTERYMLMARVSVDKLLSFGGD